VTKFSKIITKNIAAVAVLAVILSAFISYHLVSASAKKNKSLEINYGNKLIRKEKINHYFVDNKATKLTELHSSTVKKNVSVEKHEFAGIDKKTTAIDPFSNIPKSRDNLDFETDPFYPKSKDEQAWLDRHGYPNAEQWREYNVASDTQLEQAALSGDVVAETLLNARLLNRGDESAETALLYSAALGNTFALEMLSSTLASGGKSSNPIDAYAFSRVAEMRGNLTLGMGREMFFPVRLNSSQRVEAEARALNYFNMLLEVQKQIQGNNATTIDLRPIQQLEADNNGG
jgi:hypothetical protein